MTSVVRTVVREDEEAEALVASSLARSAYRGYCKEKQRWAEPGFKRSGPPPDRIGSRLDAPVERDRNLRPMDGIAHFLPSACPTSHGVKLPRCTADAVATVVRAIELFTAAESSVGLPGRFGSPWGSGPESPCSRLLSSGEIAPEGFGRRDAAA